MAEPYWLILAALLGFAAGAVNALAGGGPIIVVAVLAAVGVPPTIASLTSTIALLPGQIATVWVSRSARVVLSPVEWPAVSALVIVGGAVGAVLLLLTPAKIFAGLLPFLIVLATILYAWHSRSPSGLRHRGVAPRLNLTWWLIPLSIYGGFYGGGNSFLVMALLAAYGHDLPAGAHAKNRLILLMNSAASVVFLWTGAVEWAVAAPLATGAVLGGLAGTALLGRIDGQRLRWIVIVIGSSLAAFLLLRG
jgi:uncharacterized membrane protein YfcA